MLEAGDNFLMGNLTGKSDTLDIRGSAGISPEAYLTLNARVQIQPGALEEVVREVLESTNKGRIIATPRAWRCLSPGRPNPSYRYSHIVAAHGV